MKTDKSTLTNIFSDPYVLAILLKEIDNFKPFSVNDIKEQYFKNPIETQKCLSGIEEENLNHENSLDLFTVLEDDEHVRIGCGVNIEEYRYKAKDTISTSQLLALKTLQEEKYKEWENPDDTLPIKGIQFWVYTNPKNELKGEIDIFEVSQNMLLGSEPEEVDKNKLKVQVGFKSMGVILIVMIHLDKDRIDTSVPLLSTLNHLLSENISIEEKMKYLNDKYEIQDEDLKQRLIQLGL